MAAKTPAQTYPVGQHPQLAPPPAERGIIKWLRERLLNSWSGHFMNGGPSSIIRGCRDLRLIGGVIFTFEIASHQGLYR